HHLAPPRCRCGVRGTGAADRRRGAGADAAAHRHPGRDRGGLAQRPDVPGTHRRSGLLVSRLRGLLAMRSAALAEDLLDTAARRRLAEVADVCPQVLTAARDVGLGEALAQAAVLLTGWGAPRLDGELLARAPRLRLVAHAAGSVKSFLTPEAWRR